MQNIFQKIRMLFTSLVIGVFCIVNIIAINFISLPKTQTASANSINTSGIFDNANLKPLFDDGSYADKTKDRINIVFFMTSTPEDKNLLLTTIRNGIGLDGDLFGANYPNSTVRQPNIGLLEVAPFNQNTDKFNFWLYDQVVDKNQISLYYTTLKYELSRIFGMDYVLPVFTLQGTLVNRSFASFPQTQYDNNGNIASYHPGELSMYYTYIEEINPNDNFYYYPTTVFIHEIFHAIASMYDEYIEPGMTTPLTGAPNCAPNLQTAQDWWGNYRYQVHPFFYEFRASVAENYFDEINGSYYIKDGNFVWGNLSNYQGNITLNTPFTLDDILSPTDFQIDYVQGGCLSEVFVGQYRPSVTSIMNTSPYPIPTYVHTNHTQQILDLFNNFQSPKPKISNIDINSYNSGNSTFNPSQTFVQYCEVFYATGNSNENMYCEISTTQNFVPQQEMTLTLMKVVDENLPINDIQNLVEYALMNCWYSNSVGKYICIDILFGTSIDVDDKFIFVLEGADDSSYLYNYYGNSPFNLSLFNILGTQNPVTILNVKILLEGALITNDGGYNNSMRNQVSAYNELIENQYIDDLDVEILDMDNKIIQKTTGKLGVDGYIYHKGTIGLKLNTITYSGQYKINIKHRNHIGIGSNLPLNINLGETSQIDFTSNNNTIFGNQKELPNGLFALHMGDVNNNTIRNAGDRNDIINAGSQIFVYSNYDVNMDSVVNSTDRNILIKTGTVIEYLN